MIAGTGLYKKAFPNHRTPCNSFSGKLETSIFKKFQNPQVQATCDQHGPSPDPEPLWQHILVTIFQYTPRKTYCEPWASHGAIHQPFLEGRPTDFGSEEANKNSN